MLLMEFVAPYLLLSPVHRPWDRSPDEYFETYQQIKIPVKDSVLLDAYFVPSTGVAARGTVLVLHGIGGNKEKKFWMAKNLAERGFNALIYDARAHGQSEGSFNTFGCLEKHDVSFILDFLQQEYPQSAPYGIWGHSLGGAVSLQAVEREDRLRAAVVESTFARLDQTVPDYMERYAGFKSEFLSNWVLRASSKYCGCNLRQVAPVKSAERISVPVFVAHGDADGRIAHANSERIYDALESEQKELVIVEGGGHVNIWRAGGEAYMEKLLSFLEQHLK